MSEIILGEVFHSVLKEKVKINEEIINYTFKEPDIFEHLDTGFSLYLKKFPNDRFSHLLLGTQVNNEDTFFCFAYWIPREIVINNITLVDLLESFANNFGCVINVLGQEGFFIKKATKVTQSRVENLEGIMEILGPKHIPCEVHIASREIVSSGIHTTDFCYCFSVNNYKYLTWLYDVEIARISVERRWHSYISELNSMLDPFGKTSIDMLHSKLKEPGELLVHNNINQISEKVSLDIPKNYLNMFNRINEVISRLETNGKISIRPKVEIDRCIFCGSEETSREHIFPQWMKAYFKEMMLDRTARFGSPDESLLDLMQSAVYNKKQSSYGFISLMVCIDCNTTWMSKLEEKIKNILSKDNNSLKQNLGELLLDEQKSKNLAIWVMVKAILFCLRSPIKMDLPVETYSNLKEGKILDGYLIEIAFCDAYQLGMIARKGASGTDSFLRLKSIDRTVAEEIGKNFFVVSMQVGNFLFRVSHFNDSEELKRYSCVKPTEVLFPASYKLLHHVIENETKIWDESEDILKLHLFSTGISLTDC